MTLSIHTELPPLMTDHNGTIRVGKTRVTLETVIGAFLAGYTPEEIVMQFPALALADIYSVIGYYLHHQVEVEAYLQQVAVDSAQVRLQLETHFDRAGIRERLLARQNGSQ